MKFLCTLTVFVIFINGYSQTDGTILNFASPGSLPEPRLQQEIFTPDRPWWQGFDMNISVLPGLVIGGAGHYLGSEVILTDQTRSEAEEDLPENIFFDARRDYDDLTVPIITNPDPQMPFMLDIGYTYDQTRFGLSWFRLAASYEKAGQVPGLDFYFDDLTERFAFGFVSFWNMGWDLHDDRDFPASWVEGFRDHGEIEDEDDLDEDLPYDLDFFPERGITLWEASSDISFNSFQLTARHTLLNNDNLRLSLTGGLQYGRWKDNLRQMLNITAHRETTDRWVQMVPVANQQQDSMLVEVFFNSIFHNDITLETNSSAEFNSFGLVGSFEAAWRITPSLSLLISGGGSTLAGNALYKGIGIDIDDIVFSERFVFFDMDGNRFPFDPEEGLLFLSGEFNLPEYTKSILSVGYNMNLSISYRITDNIEVMAGYHYSIWTNLPLSPVWSYSSPFTRPYDAFALEESWDKERSANISTSGFRVGVGLRF